MHNPSTLTVIAKLKQGLENLDSLESLLRDRVNPTEGGADQDLKFSTYPNLHFCAFCVTRDQGKDMPAQLVLEATFDGPADTLIRDLVAKDPEILIEIFSHCQGFPKTAYANPQLMEIYLQQQSIEAQTFFSGAPGRRVSQIKLEQRLRHHLLSFLQSAPASVLGAEPRRLQDHLRRAAMDCDDVANAAQAPADPWSVRNGDRVLGLVGRLTYAGFFFAGFTLFQTDTFGWATVWRGLVNVDAFVAAKSLGFAMAGIFLLYLGHAVFAEKHNKVRAEASPHVLMGILGAVSIQLKLLSLIWAVLITLAIGNWLETLAPREIIGWLLASGIWLAAFAILYAIVLVLMGLRAAGRFLSPGDEALRFARAGYGAFFSFALFWGVFFLSLTPLVALFDMALGAENWDVFHPVDRWLINIFGAISIGLIVLPVLWLTLLALHEAMLAWEHFQMDAKTPTLAQSRDRLHISEREEHGYNRRQNHYISLTDVKPGLLRNWFLRLILLVINFVARYKDNKGNLGGITTIFSARWVLIDNGKRLLFMTNYSGAWDSYLNEFSELASVIGVNLIWTSTWIAPDPGETQGMHFPRTRYFIGRGARATLPFKAYVRRSQIETLAWYGAYRDLSVINVVENAKIRDAVFGPTDVAALDLILKRT